MAINDSYHVYENDLEDGESLTIEGSEAETNAAEVQEMAGTGDAEIYRETDVDGDGTFEISILVDSFTGEWHRQGNALLVSDKHDHRLRIKNVSGDTADFYATGLEVDD